MLLLKFTNPLDSTDTLEVTLGTDSLANSPNILTLANDTEKNLDGYNVKIKGFQNTTVSSHNTVNHDIINLSQAVDGALPDGSRLSLTSSNGTDIRYYSASSYSTDGSTHQVTLSPTTGVLDLSTYKVEFLGIPENTTVNLPSGIIEGYNSRLNTIQVLLNNKSYTVDNNTYYCLKKGYNKTTGFSYSYLVNLDGNKILNDDYYNNWKIEVESEKNKGYYESSSDYIINDYKKQKHITDYETEHSGIIINSSSLPMMVNPIGKDYFKGWTIGITSETITDEEGNTGPNFSSVTTVRGSIISHDESTQDDTIPDNTLITNVVSDHQGPNGMYVSIITISPLESKSDA